MQGAARGRTRSVAGSVDHSATCTSRGTATGAERVTTGTRTRICVGWASTTAAGAFPMRTVTRPAWLEKPEPRSVTTAPTSASGGSIPVSSGVVS
jgi:hypothetical protein